MSIDVKGNIISSSKLTSTGVFKTTIVRDSLILHLDAANQDSYPGSGIVWYDLSGNGANLSTNGSPSWTTLGGRTAFNLTADGDYFSGGISNFPTTELTLEAWLYPAASEITAGDRGAVILANGGSGAYMSWNKSSQYMSDYWYGHAPEGYHEQVGPSSRSNWHHWCCVWDNKSVYQWVDGVYGTVNGVSGSSASNTNIWIGREGSSRQFSGGFAIIRIYSRALNPYEVAQNFQAQRGRFGL